MDLREPEQLGGAAGAPVASAAPGGRPASLGSAGSAVADTSPASGGSLTIAGIATGGSTSARAGSSARIESGGASANPSGGVGVGPVNPSSEGYGGYTFDTDLQGWKVQYSSAGGAASVVLNTDIAIAWTSTEGTPAPPLGAAKVSIPYTSLSQYVGVGVNFAGGLDLSNRILRARVKILSGLGDPLDLMVNPGGAKLYVKTGAGYLYATGTYTNLAVIGTWIPLEFELMDPLFVDPSGVFDPRDVRELGVQFDTSGTSQSAQPAVILVDTVIY